jgi:hypothetical protein
MLAVFAVILVGLLMVITGAVPGNVSASTGSSANSTLTPDQLAAGGPLPGNLSLIESEQECIKSLQNETNWAPWYPTMVNTEHGGSERTGVFECAQFGGSYTEPNQVYAYQSPTSLGTAQSWIDTREPNEVYVSGGGTGLGLPGPFVSKMEAGSWGVGQEWR